MQVFTQNASKGIWGVHCPQVIVAVYPKNKYCPSTLAVAKQPQSAPAVAEQPQSTSAVAEQPQSTPAVAEQPQSAPAVAEQPQSAPAVAEQPQFVSNCHAFCICAQQM